MWFLRHEESFMMLLDNFSCFFSSSPFFFIFHFSTQFYAHTHLHTYHTRKTSTNRQAHFLPASLSHQPPPSMPTTTSTTTTTTTTIPPNLHLLPPDSLIHLSTYLTMPDLYQLFSTHATINTVLSGSNEVWVPQILARWPHCAPLTHKMMLKGEAVMSAKDFLLERLPFDNEEWKEQEIAASMYRAFSFTPRIDIQARFRRVYLEIHFVVDDREEGEEEQDEEEKDSPPIATAKAAPRVFFRPHF
jgi:hypothetical protein